MIILHIFIKLLFFVLLIIFIRRCIYKLLKVQKFLLRSLIPLPSVTLWGGGGKPEQTFMLFANNFALSTCLPILVCGGRRGDRGKLMFDIFPPKPLTKGEKAKISSPEIGGPVETMDIQFTRPYTIIKSIWWGSRYCKENRGYNKRTQ